VESRLEDDIRRERKPIKSHINRQVGSREESIPPDS
jgi:hypothetical protein